MNFSFINSTALKQETKVLNIKKIIDILRTKIIVYANIL